MSTSKTITVLAKAAKPKHHLLVLNKADAPFLVDLRPSEGYLQKHVVGSTNIPLAKLLLHKDRLKSLEKVILLAEADTLSEAEEAYLILTALGFDQVFVVPNGLAVCKTAKLSFTTLTDARMEAFSTWFNAMPKEEKVPTAVGVALVLLSFLSGNRRGLVFGIGTTLLGFGLRKQLKTEQVSSIGQWVLKRLLKKLV